ncbi:MAG: ribosome-associated translation inhibitor RaiA [Chloroflexota bacterium]
MQLSITGRNVDITDYTRGYLEKKMRRVERHLPGLTEARVELASESTKGAGQRNVAQVTLRAGGKILRGEERAGDLFTAIDAVMEKVVRQVDRFKEKRQHRNRKQPLRESVPVLAAEVVAEYEETAEETDVYQPIVKLKRFQTLPMTTDEAIEQMELLGHTFFVFYNANDGHVNVIYRRDHGDYGLLIPELA